MDEDDLRARLDRLVLSLERLVPVLEKVAELLPEPGSIKARLTKRRVTADAMSRFFEEER